MSSPHFPARRVFLLACATAAAMGYAASPQAAASGILRELKAGDFLWHPEVAPAGPLVILVSLDEQRVYVYRNGIAIGVSTISSGKPGHETPTGVFTILQKARDHRSNLYNSAPMPYMQRLTWDGIALHGGALPGRPASHGCVRLPQKFAEQLFATTARGDTVVVTDARVDPARIAFPSLLAPVAPGDAPAPAVQVARAGTGDFWDDSAPAGPVSIVASLAEDRVYVLRNGVAMASARLQARPDARFEGALLLVMGTQVLPDPSPLDRRQPRHQWTSYTLAGSPPPLQRLEDGIVAPPEFMRKLYGLLAPGTTLLITSLPAVYPAPRAPGPAPRDRVLESDG